jgi:mono/diheme cytochrome c family protein
MALMAGAALLGSCASDTISVNVATAGDVAATTSATVDNFMLVDQNMEAHELYRLADAKAVVLVTHASGDAELRRLAPALNALAAKHPDVEFRMLNSSLKDNFDTVAADAGAAGVKIPVLLDRYQLVGEALGVTRAAEVIIVNPKTWGVAYRGAAAEAGPALDAVLAGKTYRVTASNGSAIAFPERAKRAEFAKISYARDVAPILERNCVACHSQGGIGPFAMSSYDMVKGFAPMIRETIRTDRMPPYNADPHVGKFSDNKNMTAAEIKTLVHWIEAGAPRGEGADPLAVAKHVAPEWPLGKPDLVLNIPSYKVPASGIVDYQRPYTVNPLTEGKWIRATTVKPGDRKAVHHVLTGWMKDVPGSGQTSSETRWRGSVGGYAVGAESNVFGGDVGTFLPAGGAVGYQMHYTPYGKETTDNSQIGVYFRKDAPKYIMRSVVVIDSSIELQPNTARHKETAYVYFEKDALLYSAFPHAHYRAYSNDLWLQTPDGKKKLLLSLPRYDFNWQRAYTFAEPIKIPAGSKLIANYVYDNSKRNPSNPDPKIKVTWGEQSHEEMLFTSVSFRWLDETAAKQIDNDARFANYRMFGMMDDNLDGKLQKAELRGQMAKMIAPFYERIDANKDGALDVAEMKAAQSMLPQRRRGSEAQNGPNENTPLT